ncbi:MAG: hypothetical protein IJ937_08395, partial [Treponema sp.]|nr:hypothetical protein [Treponema sp.]
MIKKESVMMSLLSGSKKLKRVIGVFSFLLLSSFFVFSQSYANKANRKTAERCLKIAESCLLANDYSNAKKQVELGLTYEPEMTPAGWKPVCSLNLPIIFLPGTASCR